MTTKTIHRIEFEGAQGDMLAARLDLPVVGARAYAIFAHCFTCSKDLTAAFRISRALARRGIGVLRFDFTGLGHSEGEFSNTNFSSNVQDLLHAAAWLREHYEAPALLVGHSLGGAAVLAAAPQIPEVTAVATIAAPSDPAHLERLLPGAIEEIEQEGEAAVTLGGRTFTVKRQFLEDIREQNLLAKLPELGRALLVMHSPKDELVGMEHAHRIFEPAAHPKSFLSLGEADHLLTGADDAEYAASVLAAWAHHHLPAAPKTDAVAPGEVSVEETGVGKFAQRVRVGAHTLVADEPRGVGGDDAGPGPYDLLLAGLGACTSMTLRMYADRKGWPLGPVAVRLSHDRIHAADCEDCADKPARVDRIRKWIDLPGDLSDAQRARLLEIADRCPVHRTITSDIQIVTESG